MKTTILKTIKTLCFIGILGSVNFVSAQTQTFPGACVPPCDSVCIYVDTDFQGYSFYWVHPCGDILLTPLLKFPQLNPNFMFNNCGNDCVQYDPITGLPILDPVTNEPVLGPCNGAAGNYRGFPAPCAKCIDGTDPYVCVNQIALGGPGGYRHVFLPFGLGFPIGFGQLLLGSGQTLNYYWDGSKLTIW